MRPSRRDCLVGMSYTCLCFLPALSRLSDSSLNYFRSGETFHRIFLPILLLQIAILSALLLAWLLCFNLPQAVRRLLFLASLCLPSAAIAQSILTITGSTSILQKGLYAALLLTIVLLARSLGRLTQWARNFLLFLSPGSILLWLYAAFSSFHYIGFFQDQTPKPKFLSQRPIPVRVVWVVFDELDYDVLISHRPASLKLHAFDQLMAESISGSQTRQPGSRTRDSIPALITGREISETRPVLPNDLTLVWKDVTPNTASWHDTPGIFDDVGKLGINSAVAGWYHPYGRFLGQRVNWFTSRAAEDFFGLDNQNATGPLLLPWKESRTREQLIGSIIELPVIGKLPSLQKNTIQRQHHWKRYEELHRAALQLVADDTFGLVFLHLPVPHPPGIWSRRSGEPNFQNSSYLDNIALADLALRDIMQSLNMSGELQRTALLVTADHGWRRSLWSNIPGWTLEETQTGGRDVPKNVPFFLRMPGQTESIQYNKPFSAVLTRCIIGQILSGKLKTSQDIVAFLSKNIAP